MKEENLIKDKSYKFALEIIELYKFLIAKNEYVLSKQILRSGTSVGTSDCSPCEISQNENSISQGK